MALLRLPSHLFRTTKTAVAPKKLGMNARITMGSKRLLSSSSNKETISNEEVDFESTKEIKFETGEDLQLMTVHELRTISRRLGVPARGRKHDLISALKSYMDSGKGVTSKMKSSDVEVPPSITSGNPPSEVRNDAPSKSKCKKLTVGDQEKNSNPVVKVLTYQRRKRGGKPPRDDDVSLGESSKRLTTEQRLSVKTNKNSVLDTNSLRTKKKGLVQIENEESLSTKTVGLLQSSSEPWTVLAHKKPLQGWIPYNPRTMRPPPLDANTNFVKLISWNVNGLRALLKLDSFSAFAQRESFDILCLQETKLQEKHVEEIKERLVDGYDNSYWACSVSKLGYSGAAIISRIKPLSVRYGLGVLDHDSEGRVVTAEFDTFYLISGYVPNSGEGLKRLTYRVTEWDIALGKFMKELEKSKPVILTGDLNCAHQEIDIYNPAGNKRSAGFTIEERESFERNFLCNGFVDTFRRQHPGVVGYTFWGFRHGGRVDNKGWRLDYFLVSESIADKVHDSYINPDVTGSDHCPIGLILKL